MMEYVCPNCNHHMHVPEAKGGQQDRCEQCGHAITYPDPAGLATDGPRHGAEPMEGPPPPAQASREEPAGRFTLNWAGLTLNQQIGVVGFVLTLFLILMCAGFGWPRQEAVDTEATVHDDIVIQDTQTADNEP